MGKIEQGKLTLIGGLQVTRAAAVTRLLAAIRHVDQYGAPKRLTMIDRLQIRSESHLSEALKGEKHFPIDWLPGYVEFDSEDRIANEIALWRGGKVVPLKPLTAAQRLRRIEKVLERMGPAGEFVREQADRLPDEDDEAGEGDR